MAKGINLAKNDAFETEKESLSAESEQEEWVSRPYKKNLSMYLLENEQLGASSLPIFLNNQW